MANLNIINQGRQLIAGTGLTTPLVVDGPGGPSMMPLQPGREKMK